MRGVVEWVVEPRRKRERSDGVSETMQHGYCLRIRVVGPKKYFGKNGRSRLLRLRSSLLSFRFGVDRQGADRFCDDTIDHEFRESPPGKRSEILLVVEFDVFAAQQHQLAGERFVFDGKFEFVGLDRTGRFGPYAGLDQLAFVGFEDEPFLDDIVQLSAFDALAEDEEEADVEECGQGDDK